MQWQAEPRRLSRNSSINNRPSRAMAQRAEEECMSSVTFNVEKMYRLPDAGGLKAFADVSVNDVLVIRGVRLVEGKKGLFVSMPQ